MTPATRCGSTPTASPARSSWSRSSSSCAPVIRPDSSRSMKTAEATVIVVSHGDKELLKLQGRKGWHFPQTEEGLYAGCRPGNSTATVRHLEGLRAHKGQYLVFPRTSFWRLKHCKGLTDRCA